MTPKYQQLPSVNSTRQVKVTMSQLFDIDCRGCGYKGPAKRTTGVSVYPIYSCPKCHKIVQLEAK